MNKIRIDIYQGLIIPLNIEHEKLSELLQDAIADLIRLKINFPLDPEPNVSVKVTMLKTLNRDKKKLWEKHKRHARHEIFLKFSCVVYFKDQDFPDFTTATLSSNDFYTDYVLIPLFEKRYYDFLIALDIARVGAFHHGQALLFANNKFIKPLINLSLHSYEIVEYALETKWPTLESLDILKTWDWYLNKAFPAKIDEISVDSLSRAINAFSHLYSDASSDIESLFWAMVGIESLFVTGKENITDQVKKKIPLFLGEIKEHKNRLTKMYDYRSGFFHGGQNFPNYFHIHDGLDSHEKFVEDYGRALIIAKTVLIATLQKMAKYNMEALRFEYVLANTMIE